ncbi:MAG: rhomboid family intramembrane serine protease [Firmicutes bacterium]|nr:rhomboid family intramembrane serine protease [Bacillota bacterium]
MIKPFKKIHYNAPVILTFTFLSFFILVLGELTNDFSTRLFFSVYKSSMSDFFFYIRLVGHVLGHINYEHFFSNFLLILLIGPMLEEKYGSKNMILMIVFTAIISGVLHILFFDSNALLGASGVVFMLILLSSFVNIKKDSIPLTLILVIIIFIGKELYNGLLAQDNISQITHIVGGFCGGVFGYMMHNKEKVIEEQHS